MFIPLDTYILIREPVYVTRGFKIGKIAEKIHDMTQSPRIWNWLAKRYAKSPIQNETVFQKKLLVTQEYLKPNMKVLEFGCGTGSIAIAHAPYVTHILATDFSENMLTIAREKTHVAGIENITFELTSIENLQADGNSFNAVLGLSILHLVEDKQKAIAKVYDLLEPGGIFVSNTPCLANISIFVRYLVPFFNRLGIAPLVRFFSEDELETAFTQAGFLIDYRWKPDVMDSLFLIAKKPL